MEYLGRLVIILIGHYVLGLIIGLFYQEPKAEGVKNGFKKRKK